MADNTQLNPGTGGDTISTDEVSGAHIQRVKLVDGTDNSGAVIPGDATNGLFVNVKALPSGTVAGGSSLPAGTAVIGKVDVNTDPSHAADGGALPAVQSVVAAFDGVNTQVLKSDNTGVLQVQPAAVVPVSDNGSSLTVDGTVDLASSGDVAGTLTNGRRTVAVPGTAVALASSATCAWVAVTALASNTDRVAVGGTGVLATAGSETGVQLVAGASVTIPTDDVASVFVDAVVGGEGVSFLVGVL